MSKRKRYLHIERWSDFQHYKDRAPKWIKTYTKQLHDHAYQDLTPYERALLHDLRLAYAIADRQLTDSTTLLSRDVGYRVRRRSLDRLKEAGFIRFSASATVPKPPKNASPDVDEELEKEGELVKGDGVVRPLRPKIASQDALDAADMLADKLKADDAARATFRKLARELPPAAFHNVRADVAEKTQERGRLESPIAYAIGTLRSMRDENQYGRAA